jgi:hypothetical protein
LDAQGLNFTLGGREGRLRSRQLPAFQLVAKPSNLGVDVPVGE